jgi:hypothetical protein
LGQAEFAILVCLLFLSPLALVVLPVWWARKTLLSTRGRQVATSLAGVAFLIVFYFGVWTTQVWFPGIHVFARQTPWYDVQIWARENTPKDAIFITPPVIWWLYESDWRVFSERRPVATLTELYEAPFNPDYTDHWIPRFSAVAPGALEQFRGDDFENVRIARRAFEGLSTAALMRIACDYDASYLVVNKPRIEDLALVYQNSDYSVYDLRGETCAPQ